MPSLSKAFKCKCKCLESNVNANANVEKFGRKHLNANVNATFSNANANAFAFVPNPGTDTYVMKSKEIIMISILHHNHIKCVHNKIIVDCDKRDSFMEIASLACKLLCPLLIE